MKTTRKSFFGITKKERKFIIHPEFFDASNILSHLFIQNLKHKPNMVQYLSRKMKKSLLKHILDNSVNHQMHQTLLRH